MQTRSPAAMLKIYGVERQQVICHKISNNSRQRKERHLRRRVIKRKQQLYKPLYQCRLSKQEDLDKAAKLHLAKYLKVRHIILSNRFSETFEQKEVRYQYKLAYQREWTKLCNSARGVTPFIYCDQENHIITKATEILKKAALQCNDTKTCASVSELNNSLIQCPTELKPAKWDCPATLRLKQALRIGIWHWNLTERGRSADRMLVPDSDIKPALQDKRVRILISTYNLFSS